ncbi:MAG TPA: (2Fe-2S)-binding protein [Polyangia bacterium]|jgi:aerobic-type carbon monoxide dehydrogenase small subunit (CoxS/CutS family)|nr:(2Fe-2S)-binding protein [Polyangia bacterium]
MRYKLEVNGEVREVNVPRSTNLLSVLRDDLDLTGARFGCGRGRCGACYVLTDGQVVASCLVGVEEAVGKKITTVEGLAKGECLHPVQEAFLEEDALQCGYCTSGMMISAVALLDRTPHPTEGEIREALAGNLCRCGVYLRAVQAVRRACGERS